MPARSVKLAFVTPELTADSPTEPPKAAPTTAGMTTKVVKGSMWTLVGQIAPLAVSLVTTPFVIRMLGAEGYGVLILIGLIPGYFGFADFGMSIASTKFGSEAYAANDPDHEARVVRTAAVIALLTSLPIAMAIVAFSGPIVTLFNVPEQLQVEAALALKFAAVTFVANFLNGIFNTPQLARLRMDLNTFVTSGFRIVGIAATPIVIYLGGGILGAAVVLMTASLLTLAGHILISGRLLPRLFDLTIERGVIRPLLSFGITIVFALAAAMLLANLEKLLLPRFASVEVFAYYSVAFTLATMMTLFSNSMSQSLIPAFSRLFAEKKNAHVQELYSRALRINLIVFTPTVALLMVVARPFFTVWAGQDFGENSTGAFYILLLGLIFNFSATVAGAVMIAAQKTKASAILYWTELAPYIMLAGVLTYYWGAVGAALAWSIRVIAEAVALLMLVKKLVGLRVDLSESRIRQLLMASLFLIGAPILAIYAPSQYALLLIVATLGLATYSGLVWRTAITESERSFIVTKLRGFAS